MHVTDLFISQNSNVLWGKTDVLPSYFDEPFVCSSLSPLKYPQLDSGIWIWRTSHAPKKKVKILKNWRQETKIWIHRSDKIMAKFVLRNLNQCLTAITIIIVVIINNSTIIISIAIIIANIITKSSPSPSPSPSPPPPPLKSSDRVLPKMFFPRFLLLLNPKNGPQYKQLSFKI